MYLGSCSRRCELHIILNSIFIYGPCFLFLDIFVAPYRISNPINTVSSVDQITHPNHSLEYKRIIYLNRYKNVIKEVSNVSFLENVSVVNIHKVFYIQCSRCHNLIRLSGGLYYRADDEGLVMIDKEESPGLDNTYIQFG